MDKQKAIIFDLDGTLIDSLEDIAVCMNIVLKEFALPTHEIIDYKKFVGGGVDILVENVLDSSTPQTIKQNITKRFKEIYDQNMHAQTKAYDGIYPLLDELTKLDFKLGILSNKPHDFTVQYANNLFTNYNFDEVHGQKAHIEKKPNPTAAINIADSFNLPCEEIYFVGDTKVDMQTAKNAGMIAIGVLWGFRDEIELKQYGADFIVNHPSEILNIVEDKYIPISCQLYDQLEAYAVKNIKNKITYKINNKEKVIEDYIIDFKTENKSEFMILKSGEKIRLDKVLDICRV